MRRECFSFCLHSDHFCTDYVSSFDSTPQTVLCEFDGTSRRVRVYCERNTNTKTNTTTNWYSLFGGKFSIVQANSKRPSAAPSLSITTHFARSETETFLVCFHKNSGSVSILVLCSLHATVCASNSVLCRYGGEYIIVRILTWKTIASCHSPSVISSTQTKIHAHKQRAHNAIIYTGWSMRTIWMV